MTEVAYKTWNEPRKA